jgi:metal-dependent hydrolase (beta-lactamase superfamily II)
LRLGSFASAARQSNPSINLRVRALEQTPGCRLVKVSPGSAYDASRYKAPTNKTIISEFGLSMHAESHRGSEVRNVLNDFSFTPESVNSNMELLGIDAATLDALVLSHGH